MEGIDGSGKRTQLELLAQALVAKGIEVAKISFPNYEGFFGRLVAQFLNGHFGPLEAVDPHFSASLYAGDRLEAAPTIRQRLDAGQTLLADRYIASNLAHQGARVAPARRGDFLKWLRELEYQVYALPQEDLVLYLRVQPDEAQRLVGEKGKREYTALRRDLQESNLAHLKAASEVYDQIAQQANWVTIDCHGPTGSALRSPESIHGDVLAAVSSKISIPQAMRS